MIISLVLSVIINLLFLSGRVAQSIDTEILVKKMKIIINSVQSTSFSPIIPEGVDE